MIKLVMALSTLSIEKDGTVKGPSKCRAKSEDGFFDWEEKYRYQLEPLVC